MKLEGEIGEIQLIERLVELWREQFTGAIRFENDGIIKIIYFKSGDVLSASTNDRSDSIDEILMRAGKVSREHVKQALAKRKENETLGDALLNLGFITRKELSWARRVQVIGVIRSILGWSGGSFTVVADYLPKREEGTLFPLPQILVELIVTEQDRQKFERAMDGGAAVFTKAGDFDDVFRRLGLNEDAEVIAAQIDGTNTAAEIAQASGKDTFNVYKLLHALTILGVLREKPRVTPEVSAAQGAASTAQGAVSTAASAGSAAPAAFDDFSFETAGVADAADIWNEAPAQEAAGVAAVVPETEFDTTARFEMDDTPAPSLWDEEPEADAAPLGAPEVPLTTAKLPAWDAPAREPAAVPIPAPIEPPAEAEEEQWGFDEAQLETARRAAEPASGEPLFVKEPRRGRHGLLVALMVIFVFAALGYGGFWWWQKQQQQGEPVVTAPRPKRPPLRPGATSPAVASTDTTTSTMPATAFTNTAPAPATPGTSTAPAPATASAGAAATPLTITAPPPAAATITAPPPAAGTITAPRPATTASAAPTPAPATATSGRTAASTPPVAQSSGRNPAPAAKPATPGTTASAAPTPGPASATGGRSAASTPPVAHSGRNPAPAAKPTIPATTSVADAGAASSTALPVVKARTPSASTPSSSVALQRPAGGSPIMTNTAGSSAAAPAAAGNDPLRARYDEMARHFAANPSGNFAVQFAIFCKPSSVSNALKAGGSNVWFLKHGGSCYRAYYGHYATRDEAQRALGSLPASLRDPAAKVTAVPR